MCVYVRGRGGEERQKVIDTERDRYIEEKKRGEGDMYM